MRHRSGSGVGGEAAQYTHGAGRAAIATVAGRTLSTSEHGSKPKRWSVVHLEPDDDIRRLRLVRCETVWIRFVPTGNLHDLALGSHLRGPCGLDDVEAVAVEEESVIAEQSVELGNQRVVVGDGLRVELRQRSLHQCGSQFHGELLLMSEFLSMTSVDQARGTQETHVRETHSKSDFREAAMPSPRTPSERWSKISRANAFDLDRFRKQEPRRRRPPRRSRPVATCPFAVINGTIFKTW